MEERQVTIDGVTHKMGELYTILATQNPIEQEGTYRLPEAQLDRFLMKITMDYPSVEEETDILLHHQQDSNFVKLDTIKPVLTKAELLELRKMLAEVIVDESLLRYIVEIVQQTRTSRAVFSGASPRASVAILQCAKAYALLQGRDFITPDDISDDASIYCFPLSSSSSARATGFPHCLSLGKCFCAFSHYSSYLRFWFST